ncbi:MAG TPA: response regulator [Armatimonadota bacterium]|jgi:CheY-like chemotaxis protein
MATDSKRILVVDDDPDIAESLRMVLESASYDVETAGSPAEAFELLDKDPPDLVLLDIMMPDGTEGFHFVWKLRNEYDPPLNSIPIIVLSAIHSTTQLRFYPDQTDKEYGAGEFLPVQGFMDKPVEPSALLKKIREVWG